MAGASNEVDDQSVTAGAVLVEIDTSDCEVAADNRTFTAASCQKEAFRI
jgi:multidrug resistance efflux pump